MAAGVSDAEQALSALLQRCTASKLAAFERLRAGASDM